MMPGLIVAVALLLASVSMPAATGRCRDVVVYPLDWSGIAPRQAIVRGNSVTILFGLYAFPRTYAPWSGTIRVQTDSMPSLAFSEHVTKAKELLIILDDLPPGTHRIVISKSDAPPVFLQTCVRVPGYYRIANWLHFVDTTSMNWFFSRHQSGP